MFYGLRESFIDVVCDTRLKLGMAKERFTPWRAKSRSDKRIESTVAKSADKILDDFLN